MDEAVSLYEQGIASVEDIDLACKKALNHPIGPKQSIVEKFEKGELGRKTGKGWYDYTK